MNLSLYDLFIAKLNHEKNITSDEATIALLDRQIAQLLPLKVECDKQIAEAERLSTEQGYCWPANDAFVPHLPKFTILSPELEKDLIHEVQFYYKNYKDSYEAIRGIQKKFQLSTTQANTYFNTCFMALRNQMTMDEWIPEGAEYFCYIGAGACRKFCKEHLGKAYHINEILKMDNGQKLPVIYFSGGYNCMHGWRPVYESEYEEYGINVS